MNKIIGLLIFALLINGCATIVKRGEISDLVDNLLSKRNFSFHKKVLTTEQVEQLKQEVYYDLIQYNTKDKLDDYLNNLYKEIFEAKKEELSSPEFFMVTQEEFQELIKQKIESHSYNLEIFYWELKLSTLIRKYSDLYQQSWRYQRLD